MKRPAIGHVIGYTALTVMLTAGAAQSLAGADTVFSDDITDGNVTSADIKDQGILYADIKDGAMTGKKILDGSITGADINEGTLSPRSFFATVTAAGAVINASPGVTATRVTSPGVYRLTFPRDMTKCSAVANPALSVGSDIAVKALFAYTEIGTGIFTGSTGQNQVGVVISSTTNDVNSSFAVVATCP